MKTDSLRFKGVLIILLSLVFLSADSVFAGKIYETVVDPFGQMIYVNINSNQEYFEYRFWAPDFFSEKIRQGTILQRKLENGPIQIINMSTEYQSLYEKERGLKDSLEDNSGRFFDGVVLTLLNNFLENRNKGECNPDLVYKIEKENRSSSKDYVLNYLYRNKQNTFAVFDGLLIDMKKMEFSLAFCDDRIKNIAWSKDEHYLAYTTEGTDQLLVIFDLREKKMILRKKLERVPSDLTWSPESTHVGLLTYRSRIGYWPLELAAALAGHPIPYNTFYIDQINLSGVLTLSHLLVRDVEYGEGSLVWVK